MTILIIGALILVGIVLLLLEILVIPGITVAGIAGILAIGSGIFMTYSKYGSTIGHFNLIGVFILMVIITIIALKSKTWNKVKLDTKIDSKMVNVQEDQVKIGEKGVTLSRLAPMGKVIINDETFEAQSNGEFIDQNIPIEVIKLSQNKIVVKPIKN
jgi:membrane-bound ClpP family serine protease